MSAMYKKLLELYPSELVLGASEAVVGEFGFTYNWINPDLTNGAIHYKENDTIPIVKFNSHGVIFRIHHNESNTISFHHFKGFLTPAKR